MLDATRRTTASKTDSLNAVDSSPSVLAVIAKIDAPTWQPAVPGHVLGQRHRRFGLAGDQAAVGYPVVKRLDWLAGP